MARQLQAVIRAVMGICAGVLLAGCAEDLGPDQHGQKVTAAQLDGQWLIINYWAEWCAPCRVEIPELNGLSRELGGQSVSVLGVNFDGLQGTALEKAAQDMGIGFTVLANDPAARYQLPANEALPVTYIIDDQGQLRERLLGEQTAAGLKTRLLALREEQ